MTLEQEFDAAMIGIYKRALKECGYKATRFLTMLSEQRGIKTAKALLSRDDTSDGFAALWQLGRLDLTVEALVLETKYQVLFTQHELEMAHKRLASLGFDTRQG